MSAYVIVDARVSDPEQYKQYQALSPGAIAAAGGRFLARGGRHETLEGQWRPTRMVVIEFPTYDAAKAFYDGELYRAARAKRAGATEYFNMVVVEGVAPT
ncbi:MAG: DUF1330 domain-containing protein [Betaproteobacteria bacterium]